MASSSSFTNSSSLSSETVDQGGGATFSTVHPDIIQAHILTRMDGPTLAAAACVSSQLHALSVEENLWREICTSTWPSVNDPLVDDIISSFPSGYRSFFSYSYPLLDHQPAKLNLKSSPLATELISAVDIYYQNELIYGKVQEIETVTSWFQCSPFRLDLLDPKESVPTAIRQAGEEKAWLKHLEENLSLSWIMIDPTCKRAVNMSSGKPVSVQRHWLTGEVQARYSVIVSTGQRRGSSRELVECAVLVTCCTTERGELHVREVSMQMMDMEGKGLSGRESLVILEGAMENGCRRKKGKGKEGKEKYEEFLKRKKERRESRQRKEKTLDLVCIAAGVIGLVAFWSSILFG